MTNTAFTSALLPAKQSLLPDDTPALPARLKQLSEIQQSVAKSLMLLDLSSVSPSCCVISGKRFDPPEAPSSLCWCKGLLQGQAVLRVTDLTVSAL